MSDFHQGGPVHRPGPVARLPGERTLCFPCARGHHVLCENDRCECTDRRG